VTKMLQPSGAKTTKGTISCALWEEVANARKSTAF
jgi:hypothetical protein